MSKYQDQLLKHIQDHPTFISPESRKNEMIQNFLSEPLPDLSISRTSFKWGIPVLNNPDHVIYVWMDALSNYITGLGYHPDTSSNEMDIFWPADVHLIGKRYLKISYHLLANLLNGIRTTTTKTSIWASLDISQ